MNTLYHVAVYHVELAFGGPEEGGWWFETGHPVDDPDLPLPRYFRPDENEAARAYREEVQAQLPKPRYPLSSVCSTGEYRALFQEGHPKAFPERRPHYE